MKNIFNKNSITISFVIIFSSFLFYGMESGITGRTLKNGVGCTCHDPNPSEEVIVSINGPDTLLTGETALYSVTIKGGPLVRAGTNIAASKGDLSTVSSDLKLEFNNELTHTYPKEPEGEIVTFNFYYTAPNTQGVQTLYANGNSVNFNGFNDGDKWNFAPNKIINILNPTSVIKENIISSYRLEQNYPNPFNPSTIISWYQPRSGQVSLKVFNMLGKEVSVIFSGEKPAGLHKISFDASGLANGTYFYVIQVNKFQSAKKMLLMK